MQATPPWEQQPWRFHIATRQHLYQAHDELCRDRNEKFRGLITSYPIGDASGPAHYAIELQDWFGRSITAEVGWHLLLSNDILTAMSGEDFEKLQAVVNVMTPAEVTVIQNADPQPVVVLSGDATKDPGQ